MAPVPPSLQSFESTVKMLDFDCAAGETEDLPVPIARVPSPARSPAVSAPKQPRVSGGMFPSAFDCAGGDEDDDPEVVAAGAAAARAHAATAKLWNALAATPGVDPAALKALRRQDAIYRLQAAAELEEQRCDAFWDLLRSHLTLETVEEVARTANGGFVPARVVRKILEASGITADGAKETMQSSCATPSRLSGQRTPCATSMGSRRASSAGAIKSAEQRGTQGNVASRNSIADVPFAGLGWARGAKSVFNAKEAGAVPPVVARCTTPSRVIPNSRGIVRDTNDTDKQTQAVGSVNARGACAAPRLQSSAPRKHAEVAGSSVAGDDSTAQRGYPCPQTPTRSSSSTRGQCHVPRPPVAIPACEPLVVDNAAGDCLELDKTPTRECGTPLRRPSFARQDSPSVRDRVRALESSTTKRSA